ncbi:MAG: beta-propeller fold lactonase family protein [Candidatus Sulfotelmatobacter sp.]
MFQKALGLALVMASIAVLVGCSTSSHFLFATLPAANQVAVYREDPTAGVLTQISGSPYTVGDGPQSLVLHPSGKFLYVANPGQDENDISLFTIASNGTLTEVFPRTSVAPAGSQPQLLIMDPTGGYLYVENSGSNNISVFSIDATSGALTPVSGSPFSIGLSPLNMRLAPSGKFLYVSAASQPLGLIVGFSVNAGKLQVLSPLTSTVGINPFGLAIDPGGKYLYAANTSSNSISIFTIEASGALQEVSGSPINDAYNDPVALMLDPKGQFLYVANQASNNVAVYSINSSTGLPVGLTTSTTTFSFITETSPSVLAADPTGKYLFVGNQGSSAGIQSFQVSSGNLNPIHTYTVGNTPSSIAILP